MPKWTRVAALGNSVSRTRTDATLFHARITHLPLARFSHRRLLLPCVVSTVKKLGVQNFGDGQENSYYARVSGIGYVEFKAWERLPLTEPRKPV